VSTGAERLLQNIVSLPILRYICDCSPGYVQGSDGVCYQYWSAGRVGGLVLGCLVAAVLATLIVQRVGRWYWQRRLKYNLELSQVRHVAAVLGNRQCQSDPA